MDELEKVRKEINQIDTEMSRLFAARMNLCREIAAYKKKHSLPIYDAVRELELLQKDYDLNPDIDLYYRELLNKTIELCRTYQVNLLEKAKTQFSVKAGEDSSEIILAPGALKQVGQLLDLNRKVLIVTDSGVPARYSREVADQCREPFLITLPRGEASKSLQEFGRLLEILIQASFTRQDCVIAVGGGVVGDLSGFVASCYLRGIDFYNLPTTLLAQVDSSLGGKTAVDWQEVKNVVGSFYQPKKIVIDPEVLLTLPRRQLAAGLAESIKMALTSSKELFLLLENSQNLQDDLPEIIRQSLLIKKAVVEKDPKESGLRRILNFGHTFGHALESFSGGRLLHGESVALGMLPLCSEKAAQRLRPLLEKYNLPTYSAASFEQLWPYLGHDKKSQGDKIILVYVEEIGQCLFREVPFSALNHYWEKVK